VSAALPKLYFVLLLPVLIAVFLTFDQLVRFEYCSSKENWDKDGKPRGFFWRPAESNAGLARMLKSNFALQRCAFVWLFKTEDWMKADQHALRLVRRLRVLVLIWNVGILAGAAYFLVVRWRA